MCAGGDVGMRIGVSGGGRLRGGSMVKEWDRIFMGWREREWMKQVCGKCIGFVDMALLLKILVGEVLPRCMFCLYHVKLEGRRLGEILDIQGLSRALRCILSI